MTNDRMHHLMFECGKVFTPSSPINQRPLFAGRIEELRRIIDAVNSSGRHAILYGDRGVGKTSLASILRVCCTHTERPGMRFCKVNCDKNDHFVSVWEKALSEIVILKEKKSGQIDNNESVERYVLSQWLDTTSYVGPTQIRRALAGC